MSEITGEDFTNALYEMSESMYVSEILHFPGIYDILSNELDEDVKKHIKHKNKYQCPFLNDENECVIYSKYNARCTLVELKHRGIISDFECENLHPKDFRTINHLWTRLCELNKSD